MGSADKYQRPYLFRMIKGILKSYDASKRKPAYIDLAVDLAAIS